MADINTTTIGKAESNPPSCNAGSHEKPAVTTQTDGDFGAGRARIILILLGASFTIFFTGLDLNIVATSIPAITNEFRSFNDVGWYGSAYLLTATAFQLFWGRIYKVFPIKAVFLCAIVVFQLGSLVCGVAPNSLALIVGRAICGFGCGGAVAGTFIIIAYTVPLRQRPLLNSLVVMMYGGACAGGPLLGGAFTTHVTWRWCFYINLPLGFLGGLLVGFACTLKEPHDKLQMSISRKFREFDWIGTFLFVPSMISILLALQWGGVKYSWSNGRLIALYVIFVFGMGSFVYSQIRQRERATVPPRIMKLRSMVFGSVYAFSLSAAFDQLSYFLPIWFQFVKGKSPIESGIMSLPLLLSYVLSSTIAGALISKFGQYVPFMYAGSIMLAVGAGLTTTFVPFTGSSHWIGYQILAGMGCGFGYDQPQIAAQTVVGLEDVSTSVTIITTFTTFGGAVFLSLGNNILDNRLIAGLQNVPGIDPGIMLGAGATNIRDTIPEDLVPMVLDAYNDAITRVWYVAVTMAGLSFLVALGMEWKSVINQENEPPEAKPEHRGNAKNSG